MWCYIFGLRNRFITVTHCCVLVDDDIIIGKLIAHWLWCLCFTMHFTTNDDSSVCRFICKHWTKGKVQDVLDHCHCIPGVSLVIITFWNCKFIANDIIQTVLHGCTLPCVCKNWIRFALTLNKTKQNICCWILLPFLEANAKFALFCCCCQYMYFNSVAVIPLWKRCIEITLHKVIVWWLEFHCFGRRYHSTCMRSLTSWWNETILVAHGPLHSACHQYQNTLANRPLRIFRVASTKNCRPCPCCCHFFQE